MRVSLALISINQNIGSRLEMFWFRITALPSQFVPIMIKGWDPHKQTGEDFVRIEIYNYFPPNAHGKGVFPAHTYAV